MGYVPRKVVSGGTITLTRPKIATVNEGKDD